MATSRIFDFILHWTAHWSVHSVLESFMRTLEKSLTTFHPFHAKLVCHWPQINYQESGTEQMWPTPNWLHQHSAYVFSLLFRLILLLPPSAFSSARQTWCGINHCFVVDLNMCLAHYKHLRALSIFWWVFPCVAVQTVPSTQSAITRNMEGSYQSHFYLVWVVEFMMCGCMWSNK